MALVIVIVRARIQGMDRPLIDASADLYATPWGTFRQVTLPICVFPSIRRGIRPETKVIATTVLAVSLTLPVTAQFLLRARAAKTPGGGRGGRVRCRIQTRRHVGCASPNPGLIPCRSVLA